MSSDEEGGGYRAGLGAGAGIGWGSGCRSKGRVENEGQIAGMRTSGYVPQQSLGKGFGDWEKHT